MPGLCYLAEIIQLGSQIRCDLLSSGSLMGIYYEEIESNAVGNKVDYDMFSMDFEEFLWAIGYGPDKIEDMYSYMASLTPFSHLEMDTIMGHFHDYMTLGDMPAVVKMFVNSGNFSGTLETRKQLLADYEEDITKYAKKSYKEVRYGVKFGYKNIGWSGKFYTFPYFLVFLLKRFLREAGHPGME